MILDIISLILSIALLAVALKRDLPWVGLVAIFTLVIDIVMLIVR